MYKFKQNDIFYNTVTTYPKYVVTAYSGSSNINNEITEGTNKLSGAINFFETSNFVSASGEWIINDKTFVSGNIILTPVTFSQSQVTASIYRSFIRKSGTQYDQQYTTNKAAFKILSAANTINYYNVLSKYYDVSYFLNTASAPANSVLPVPNYLPSNSTVTLNPATDINIIEIPSVFYGRSINPGTVDLQFYITGTLAARAQDVNLNGELVQTTGSTTGSIVGIVLYNEGLLLITGSSSLNTGVSDFYIQPTASTGTAISSQPRWIHYWSYKANDNSKPIVSSSYIMSFEGTEIVPTLTMLAHAEKNDLNWSNNPSYIDSTFYSKYLSVTNSMTYIENSQILINNTLSSSFENYTASFKPQTFINSIGIYDEAGDLIGVATVANPVKKTNEQDYTFKLKIDL